MTDISFHHPWVLTLVVLVPLALAVWWRGTRRAAGRARTISRSASARPPYLAAVLFSLAALAAISAAAQPRWGTRESRLPRSGADLVVVLDISRSMDARDVAPSRLAAAKTTINSVLDRLGGDRVGLVVFAGDARVRFPLTTDFAAARQVIDSLQTGVVLVEGGTSAALGLDEAVDLIGDTTENGRVILLLTDGDDLGGNPASSAMRVRNSGADLLIAGVGTAEGATIPIHDRTTGTESPKLADDGTPIVSSMNETFLRALATVSGGRYLGSDLAVVPGAVDGRLRALARSTIDERPTILPVERYQEVATAALILLVLAALAERFGRFPARAGVALAVLGLFMVGCATEAYEANEAGRDAMETGDYDLAISSFLDAQFSQPDDPQVALNLAAAYEAAGRSGEAIAAARRALASTSADVRGRAFSSIGHSQFNLGQVEESLDAFRRSLLEDPRNDDARHDYEVVLRLLFPQQQPTPPPTTPAVPTGTPTPMPGTPQDSTPPGGGGEGTPQPGTPTPGGNGTGQGTPSATASAPPSALELDRQLRQIDRQIERLLQEAGEVPTPQQALEILRLLAERSEIASLRDSLSGSGGPRDY